MTIESSRAVWVDYLRSFITLLVVGHHAALAYPTFAFFAPTHYIYSTAPVVDNERWVIMDRLIGFNDVFFMPLMFFISGLFVYRGLRRKGVKWYLKDRFVRLGIPFLVAELLIIPLAYLPSYYLSTQSTDLRAFIEDYVFWQQWPVGPPWFIWQLLAFDSITALVFWLFPSFLSAIGTTLIRYSQTPFRFGLTIYISTAIALIPLSLWVGQFTWVGQWGPFDFQLNRLVFYLLFFWIGVALGSTDWQPHLFKQGRLFSVHWAVWVVLSLGAYWLVIAVSTTGESWVKQGQITVTEGYFLYDLAFVSSCLASMAACLSVFRQAVLKSSVVWTNLSGNAYGIYILHYPFVTGLQFILLGTPLPVPVKFLIVFAGALGLSWGIVSLFRRSAVVAQIV